MTIPPRLITVGCVVVLLGCSGTATELDASTAEDAATREDAAIADAGGSSGETTYRAEVWADNWSSMYVDGVLVMEDSVSITTERSFNEEVFTFEACTASR